MLFEYDSRKSASNLAKHGIDFEEAQRIWDGPTVDVPSLGDYGEDRFVVIGKVRGKHWSAAITYREENVRIISVRRARKKEVDYYEKTNKR